MALCLLFFFFNVISLGWKMYVYLRWCLPLWESLNNVFRCERSTWAEWMTIVSLQIEVSMGSRKSKLTKYSKWTPFKGTQPDNVRIFDKDAFSTQRTNSYYILRVCAEWPSVPSELSAVKTTVHTNIQDAINFRTLWMRQVSGIVRAARSWNGESLLLVVFKTTLVFTCKT